MTDVNEIRIVCDRAALHPKHPESLVRAFVPRPVGPGWIVSAPRGHGTGAVNGNVARFVAAATRYNGDIVTLKGDERPGVSPLLLDALTGRANSSESEIQTAIDDNARGTRNVHRLECHRCHRETVDVREDRLWEVLDNARRAGIDRLTLGEVHAMLRALAVGRPDDSREQTAPSE
ncbi:MAG: hypothetical protein LKI58_11285 [Actinomyces sp.]|jgi:hypothetical protein|nr:hypothetical protein [Actinomyces sp.]MCI1788622.1 hypothetical protein [Actinomyces sp.]MCI1829724.1 hypothetical protein [Actinomyces sp.]